MGDGDGQAAEVVPVEEVTEEEVSQALTTLLHAAANKLGLGELPERFEVVVDFTLNPDLAEMDPVGWVDETTFAEDAAQEDNSL